MFDQSSFPAIDDGSSVTERAFGSVGLENVEGGNELDDPSVLTERDSHASVIGPLLCYQIMIVWVQLILERIENGHVDGTASPAALVELGRVGNHLPTGIQLGHLGVRECFARQGGNDVVGRGGIERPDEGGGWLVHGERRREEVLVDGAVEYDDHGWHDKEGRNVCPAP